MTLAARLAETGATVLMAYAERLHYGAGYHLKLFPLSHALEGDLASAPRSSTANWKPWSAMPRAVPLGLQPLQGAGRRRSAAGLIVIRKRSTHGTR
jgi:hypothetical protein